MVLIPIPVGIVDGSNISRFRARIPRPPPGFAITGAHVLELAEIAVSLSLHDFVMPENLRNSALLKIGVSDIAAFRSKTLDCFYANAIFLLYTLAIANEFKDNPFVFGMFDGSPLQVKMERDIHFLTEALYYVDFVLEDGRVQTTTSELRKVLRHFGNIGMIPRELDCRRLVEILDRYGANETRAVDAWQFSTLLLNMLREVVYTLAREPALVVLRDIKVENGAEIRKLLYRESLPDEILEKITTDQYINNTDMSYTAKVRYILGKYRKDFGLPSFLQPEMRVVLYDALLEVANYESIVESGPDTLMVVLKWVLSKIEDMLAANPILFWIVPQHG